MLLNQRLEQIVKIVTELNFVEVEKLAKDLGVSTMTIRRDLDKLHAAGMLERCHGGARISLSMAQEMELESKQKVMNLEKKRIAASALTLIDDSDCIFLDGGTTTAELAKLLIQEKKELQVVTNDLNIATILCGSKASLAVIGGEIQKTTHSAFGSISCTLLRQFRFSKAFFGAPAVDYNYDALTPTPEKAFLKRTAMEVSAAKYLLVDSNKFNRRAASLICSLSSFDAVITDKYFSKSEQQVLADRDIQILKV